MTNTIITGKLAGAMENSRAYRLTYITMYSNCGRVFSYDWFAAGGVVAGGSIAAAMQSTYYGGSTCGLFLILQSVRVTIVWRPIVAARRRWSYRCVDTTIIPVRRFIELLYRPIPTGLAMPPAMRTKRKNARNTQQLLVYCDYLNNFSSPPLTQIH